MEEELFNESRLFTQREYFANGLINLFKSKELWLEEGVSISIEGEWGIGKTFFKDKFKEMLNTEGFVVLEYNAWKNDYNEVKKCIPIISSYKGKLSDSSESLYSYLKLNDKITVLFDNLINYAHRKRDEDNRNSVYQEMCGQLSALISEVSDVSSFEIPEILNNCH